MTQPLNKRRVIVFIFEVCYYEVIEIEVLNPILKKTKRKVLNLSSLRDEKLRRNDMSTTFLQHFYNKF